MANAKDEKNAGLYRCEFCDFECSKHSNYKQHMLTPKHQKRLYSKQMDTLGNEKMPLDKYICHCNISYVSRSGLWKHKKKCKSLEKMPKMPENAGKDEITDKELILQLLKQNQEFKEQIMELVKKDNICTTNNINNTVNNNQNFNLNLFLNEQCKDALDIMDFIGSLNVQLSDLEHTGNVGYVKGVSDIFLKNLKELDVYKRPIHCSDLKREVMYVKDKDVWEKDEDKKKITLAIRHIADKNFKQIHQWLKENPDAKDAKNKKNEQYMKIVNKCTGGIDVEEDEKYYGKIISNVAKEVQIQK
jgi:hypothetical protein